MPDEHEVRRMSIDPDRLLPGEDTKSSQPEDAKHWASVYTELLGTKRRLVRDLRKMMITGHSQDAQDELERADVIMLELQIQRFEHRLAVWQKRAAELAGENEV
jgi:hypothetical protein